MFLFHSFFCLLCSSFLLKQLIRTVVAFVLGRLKRSMKTKRLQDCGYKWHGRCGCGGFGYRKSSCDWDPPLQCAAHVNAPIQLSGVGMGDLDEFLGSCKLWLNLAHLFDGGQIIYPLHVKNRLLIFKFTFIYCLFAALQLKQRLWFPYQF